MKLKESKKILKKEGFILRLSSEVINQAGAIRGFAKPEVCEAIKVANANKWAVVLSPIGCDERDARLNKEKEKNHIKCVEPVSGSPLSESEGMELKWKDNRNTSESPALEAAASQFNDALLDEQAKKIKHLTEKISRLTGIIHKKDEELRLTKIREKNLADKIVARSLKSAGRALAYKEKVIADLCKELAATRKELEEKIKLVETVRNVSKPYCEYGIAAAEEMADVTVYGKLVSPEDFKDYRRWANGYRYTPQLSGFIEEEEKKLTAKTLDFKAKCMKAARESINDVFESYAARYAKSSLDDLKEKAYESFNAKAHKLGLVGSKDGKGIIDQMISVDIAEELSKVIDDTIDRFLLFGEIIIKEEQ